MGNLFSMDGPVYKICNYIYYFLLANILWFIFSIPLVTAGASTTALFYVMGKVSRNEDVSITKDFWKSFKLNFKQATISWIILVAVYILLILSILNVRVAYGSMARYIVIIQYVVLAELAGATIYLFPVLSRCVVKTTQLFKISFFMANRHLLTTIFCGGALYVMYFILFPKMPGLFMFTSLAMYALYASFMIERVLQRYLPKPEGEGEVAEGEVINSEANIEGAEPIDIISDEVVDSEKQTEFIDNENKEN